MTAGSSALAFNAEVKISVGDVTLIGDFHVPAKSVGVVLFAHGSGSSRQSPRNRFVASTLESRGFATLLVDLLTPQEEKIDRDTAYLRFDIALLAERLVALIDWLRARPEVRSLPMGLFGASTGAAAALVAAAMRPHDISAIVSRGGRPDLASEALSNVLAPTLLIVGGRDIVVIRMNRESMVRMSGVVSLEIVSGATHLFGEPGALEAVASFASDWFGRYLEAVSAKAAG